MGRLFQFKFVGHILTLYFQCTVRVVAGNVTVKHIFQYTVIPQLDIDALPNFKSRLINQVLCAALFDNHTILHDLCRYPGHVFPFQCHIAYNRRTAYGTFRERDFGRPDQLLVALVNLKRMNLRYLHSAANLHRIGRIGISNGNTTAENIHCGYTHRRVSLSNEAGSTISVPNLTYLIHLFVCLIAVSAFSCPASLSSTASDGSTATQLSEYGCTFLQSVG